MADQRVTPDHVTSLENGDVAHLPADAITIFDDGERDKRATETIERPTGTRRAVDLS